MKLTPNLITYFRLFATAVGIFIFVGSDAFVARFAAFWVLLAAGWSDMLDGWLARRYGLVTEEGKLLDPIADKAFLLGAMWMFAYAGIYSFWWVVFFAIREIGVTVVRLWRLRHGGVIAAEGLGKLKTISQMISLLVSYFYLFVRDYTPGLVSYSDILSQVFAVLNYLLLFVALLLTYISGVSFFVNLRRRS